MVEIILQCLIEGDPEYAPVCVDSPFEWTEDIERIIRDPEFYVQLLV